MTRAPTTVKGFLQIEGAGLDRRSRRRLRYRGLRDARRHRGPRGPVVAARRHAHEHHAWAAISPGSRPSAGWPSTGTRTPGSGRWMSPGVLAVDLGPLRGPLGLAGGARARRRAHAGRPLVPRRPPQLRRHALALPGRRRRRRVVARSQTREPRELTVGRAPRPVARCRAGLVRLGVRRGDRVAAYLPNVPEAVIGCWRRRRSARSGPRARPSSAPAAVVDRFAPDRPRRAAHVDGYRYGAKDVDRSTGSPRSSPPCRRCTPSSSLPRPTPAGSTSRGCPSRCSPSRRPSPSTPCRSTTRCTSCSPRAPPALRSRSSTATAASCSSTSRPSRLHTDLGPDDRFCWFTTTGWMMWNYLVSGLAVGSTIVLFDGDPAGPTCDPVAPGRRDADDLLRASAPPSSWRAAPPGLTPGADRPRRALRGVGSTGAPAPGRGLPLGRRPVCPIRCGSLSGGTDVCTGFLGRHPLVPVWAGEISCRKLGARVAAFDDAGPSASATRASWSSPRPCRPCRWASGATTTAAGYAPPTSRRSRRLAPRRLDHHHRTRLVHHHRAHRRDPQPGRGATGHRRVLRRGRGAARGHGQPGHPPRGPGGRPGRAAAVRGRATGDDLDDDLVGALRADLREGLSPRHVPDEILAVPAIPRTLSGKKLEVPVKRILLGLPAEASRRGTPSPIPARSSRSRLLAADRRRDAARACDARRSRRGSHLGVVLRPTAGDVVNRDHGRRRRRQRRVPSRSPRRRTGSPRRPRGRRAPRRGSPPRA